MKQTRISLTLIIVALAGLSDGCATRTTVKDASRKNIRFATPKAAQMFYDNYLAAADPKGNSFALYVPLPYEHKTVSTDNVRFNAAAQNADTNHDGIITEKEAQAVAVQSQIRKLVQATAPKQ